MVTFLEDTISTEDFDNIEDKVVKETKESLTEKVFNMVSLHDISHYEALCKVMDDEGYEPEFIAKLIDPVLRFKLTEELSKINLVKIDKDSNDDLTDLCKVE